MLQHFTGLVHESEAGWANGAVEREGKRSIVHPETIQKYKFTKYSDFSVIIVARDWSNQNTLFDS